MEANGHDVSIVRAEPTLASRALEPSSVDEAFRLAERIVKGRLIPKSIQTAEAALTIILAGRELGLTAMQSIRSIHVIEGKPVMSSDLMLALVKNSPTCKYFKLIKTTSEVAEFATERVGEGETRMSFTMEQAKTAGITSKQNWRTYPDAMLRARCIAALCRVVYPDLMMGIYETDELTKDPIPQPVRTTANTLVATKDAMEAIEAGIEDAKAGKIRRMDPKEFDDNNEWIEKIMNCVDVASLKAVGMQIRAVTMDDESKLKLSNAYAMRQKELKGK